MLYEQPSFDLNNPTLVLETRPADEVAGEVTPGGIKAVKTENRRNDSVVWMHPDKIQVMEGFNLRFVNTPEHKATVRMYADSMKREGFKWDKPISCFVADDGNGGNMIVVFDGHTRLESVALANSEGAGIDAIPVALAPKTMSMDDMLNALHTNNNGNPLPMLGLALLVKRKVGRGHTNARIASDLHITTTHVENLILLSSAPIAVQDMVVSNQVAATTVVDLFRKLGAEAATAQLKQQLAAAQAAGKNKITKKNLPGAKFESALKRSAPRLFERVSSIRQDPGYAGLSDSTRQELEALVEELEVLRQGNEG